MEKIKFNIWVFFARRRIKKEIKKLRNYLNDLSWTIGVENNCNTELLKQYKETKVALFMNETMLKGLRYY